MMEKPSMWEGTGAGAGACAAALRLVFAWLGASDLWRCGSVCRMWRAVALEPPLWRRALRPHATRDTLRAFAEARAARCLTGNDSSERWSWRSEYTLCTARWRRTGRLAADRTPLLQATLTSHTSHQPRRLALLAEDADVSIWEQDKDGDVWREIWLYNMRACGWRRAESARWGGAGGAERLLLAGPLALSDRWETAVLELQEKDTWRVVCRAEAGVSGACCWANDEAFLTLQPQLLAPGLAITTVWLNTVSQESLSEYSGVRTPLLRIFNEAVSHVSHIMMTRMPTVPLGAVAEVTPEEDGGQQLESELGPVPEYYAAISAVNDPNDTADSLLVVAMGAAGDRRGQARALAAWRVPHALLRPPPLLAGTPLAERVRRQRQRAQHPPAADEVQEEEPPTESAVRALCSAPDDVCALGGQVLGLALHPGGSCVWVSTARGVTCVTLPTLRRVLRVSHVPHCPTQTTTPPPPVAPPHYVTPDVDDDYFVTPEGGGSGVVRMVTCRSAQRGASVRHAAPALTAMLAAPGSLLVLATDAVHICFAAAWMCPHTTPARHEMAAHRPLRPLRRLLQLKGSGYSATRSATQDRPPRSTCDGTAEPPCPPCDRAAPPPCRALPRRTRPALRVTCCAPQPRAPPPCDPLDSQLTCLHARSVCGKRKHTECGCRDMRCGTELDRVARRLAAARTTRREHYEREASAPAPCAAPDTTPVYQLITERECVRATDGSDYTVATTPRPLAQCPRCGPNRTPPDPIPVELTPSDACEPDRELALDPCAHRPRVLLHIDRPPSQDSPRSSELRPSPPTSSECTAPKRPTPRERLTTRIMESLSLKRESKTSYSKSTCTGRQPADRCANLPKPVEGPPRCREPTVVEQLRQRPGAPGSRCGEPRRLHTSASLLVRTDTCAASTTKDGKNSGKSSIEAVMRDRSQLKEVARGRVVMDKDPGGRPDGPGCGQLELYIPPVSESVRVRVSLDFMPSQVEKCTHSAAGAAVSGRKTSKCAVSQRSNARCGDTWLSIKGIQKKLSGSRSNDTLPIISSRAGCRSPLRESPPREPHDRGCLYPPRKPPRCSSAPEFPQTLF